MSAKRLVSIAKDFILTNRASKITPADVARHLGCSRQLAELRFSEICGKAIRRAIEDARMDEAKRRLKAGKTVNDIATAMHFTSPNELYRIYKRHFGHTIRQADA